MKEFSEKFRIEEFKIRQIGSWIISLRPSQVTIGSLILSLNRKSSSFSDLTIKEGEELINAFKEIENIYSYSFKPDKINYLALMMVDDQVHYHVIPRYENFVEFDNNIYTDVDWPKPPEIMNKLENIDLNNILDYLKSNLK